MKVMSIRIKNEREGMSDFAVAWKAASKKIPYTKQTGVYFTSLEAVRNFLTPRRLDLLHLIKERNPHSLYELARLANRSFSSIFRDVNTLTRHGLVTLTESTRYSRRVVRPRVEYDALNFKIAL